MFKHTKLNALSLRVVVFIDLNFGWGSKRL